MAREKTINNNTNILNAVNKVVDSFSFSVCVCECFVISKVAYAKQLFFVVLHE